MPLTRFRKVVFATVTLLLTLGAIEGAARIYSVLRFHHLGAMSHGRMFLRRILAGEGGLPATNEDDEKLTRAVDDMYARRSSGDDGFVPREPGTVNITGHVAHVNSLGLRGPEIAQTPSPGTLRIAAFGGSYVFGDRLADEETWPFVLGKLLDERGLPLEVVNAGGNGMNIHHVLRSVIRLTNRARVDYVLVTSANNNLFLLTRDRRYSVVSVVDEYLYNLSMFYVMLREKLGRLRGQPVDYALYHRRVHVDPAAVDRWIGMYHERLAELATLCRERGSTLVVASEPEEFYDARLNALDPLDEAEDAALGARIHGGEDVWRQELEYYLQTRLNLEAKRFAESSSDVLFFDGAGVLRGDKSRYLLDWIHLSPTGAAKLAGALADFFAEHARPHSGLSAARTNRAGPR